MRHSTTLPLSCGFTSTVPLYWDTGSAYHYVRVQALDNPEGAPTKGDTLYDASVRSRLERLRARLTVA